MRKIVRLVWMICICLCFSACGGKAPGKPEAEDDTLSMSAEKLWEAGGVAIDMKDYEKALKYYQLSAEKGYVKAWKAIGSLYYYGDGVEQSYEKALEYWLHAAEQGSAEAQASIGDLYAKGEGVEQSCEKALEYYRLAAEQGLAEALTSLGGLYENGNGVEQSYEKAAEYYRQAAEQGHAEAFDRLNRLVGEGLVEKKDAVVRKADKPKIEAKTKQAGGSGAGNGSVPAPTAAKECYKSPTGAHVYTGVPGRTWRCKYCGNVK